MWTTRGDNGNVDGNEDDNDKLQVMVNDNGVIIITLISDNDDANNYDNAYMYAYNHYYDDDDNNCDNNHEKVAIRSIRSVYDQHRLFP